MSYECRVNVQIKNDLPGDASEILLCWKYGNDECHLMKWSGIPRGEVAGPAPVEYNLDGKGSFWWVQVTDHNGRVYTSSEDGESSWYRCDLSRVDNDRTLTFTVSNTKFSIGVHDGMSYSTSPPPPPC